MASYDNLFGVPAVEVFHPSSEAWRKREPFPVLLTCEHASAALPPGYEWGEDQWLAEMHWAVDLGVKDLLVELQRRLNCPAIASCFSRLFVDINRPEVKVSGGAAEFSTTPFLTVAEERPVILNTDLTGSEMEKRLAGAWRPYHNRAPCGFVLCLKAMALTSPENTLLFAIHTFTRDFNPGDGRPIQQRSVELGVLCKPARDLQPGMPARLLMDSLLAQGVDARVNDPYGGENGPGGAVGAYGGDRPTLMIEARQDLMCGHSSEASLWRRKLLASLLHSIGDPTFATIPQAQHAALLPPDWLDDSSDLSCKL